MTANPRLSVVQSQYPEPPYPGDVRANGWQFELDLSRIEQSDTWLLAPSDMRPWLLMLWARAWQQSPCGSLPTEDALIAARLGMEPRLFAAHRDILMRGWYRASDGRLYHPVITELVVKMCAARRSTADRVARYRQRHNTSDAVESGSSNALLTRESPVSNATGTGTGTGTGIEVPTVLVASRAAKRPESVPDGDLRDVEQSERLPACPTQELVALYHQHLPMLPRCEVFNDARKRYMAARWREVAHDHRDEADVRAAALDWFAWFFGERVASSPFLIGKVKDWRADLDWLMKPTNFAKAAEGRYQREKATR